MTPEQYWHGVPSLLGNYIHAYNEKQKDIMAQAWLTGLYVRAAIQTSVQTVGFITKESEKLPEYPKFEFDTSDNTTEQPQRLTDEEKAHFQAQIQRINLSQRRYARSMSKE